MNLGTDRAGVIRTLAELIVGAGRATGADALFADAWAREQKTDTGVPGGIAIPHCRRPRFSNRPSQWLGPIPQSTSVPPMDRPT